jgi:type I restriction enzyme S subunit
MGKFWRNDRHAYPRYNPTYHASRGRCGKPNCPPDTVLIVVCGMSLAKAFRVALTKREVTFNQDLKALRCEPDVDSEFLFYALLAHRERIKELSTEASHGTKRLQTDILESYELDIADHQTQRSIADMLSAYDNLIDNNLRRIALLEESARLLYREWFVRLRFPGHEHTRIITGVPDGWERSAFEHALTLQRGFDLPIQAREDGDVPIYGSTGINGFHSKAKVLGPGVVTGRSGTLGEVHYVAENFWPLNTALWVKEFKRVTPLFSLFLMREMDLKQYNGGVSVPTLDRKTVHRVDVLIPPENLLTAFDEFVMPLFEQIRNLTLQNQQLKQARDLLLPKLMSGEMAV